MMAVPQLLSVMGRALEQRLDSRLPPAIYRNLLKAADRAPMAVRRQLLFTVHRQAIAFGPPQRQAPDESGQDFVERLERVSYALAAEADRVRGESSRRRA